jgi:UDP-N-acetylglucosamine 4,6-dehydratase/5-epimerase
MFNGKTIIITGGTGSLGKAFVKKVLEKYNPKSLRIFSRDELKQWEMANQFSKYKHCDKLRFFIGDVRDKDRVRRAFEDCDYVIHAAAMKQIPASEYNPMECIKTNIIGAQNIIECALDLGIKNVVAISSDKAVSPVNLYGASKLCAEKIFIAANNMRGKRNIKFSLVRYGNVMGSRGSVIPFFLDIKRNNVIPITHLEMTRFNYLLDDAVDLILYTLKNQWGGEVYIPKMPSYKITDVARAIAPKAKLKIIGIRPGEKLHEEMITNSESYNTVDLGKYYVVLPTSKDISWTQKAFLLKTKAKRVKQGFSYNSRDNNKWLTSNDLKQLIIKYIEPAL